MRKRDFLAHWLIRTAPTTEREISDRLDQGERMYAAFEAHHAPKEMKPAGPHQRANHVAALSEWQKAAFEQFWTAYDYKQGKNDAAGVWCLLDPDWTLVERICAAARAEASRWRDAPPQGQTRIYAQGWLSARRWEDYTPPRAPESVAATADPAQPRRAKLLNELQALKNLNQYQPTPERTQRIEAVRAELQALSQPA
jgi:hypothetical protein